MRFFSLFVRFFMVCIILQGCGKGGTGSDGVNREVSEKDDDQRLSNTKEETESAKKELTQKEAALAVYGLSFWESTENDYGYRWHTNILGTNAKAMKDSYQKNPLVKKTEVLKSLQEYIAAAKRYLELHDDERVKSRMQLATDKSTRIKDDLKMVRPEDFAAIETLMQTFFRKEENFKNTGLEITVDITDKIDLYRKNNSIQISPYIAKLPQLTNDQEASAFKGEINGMYEVVRELKSKNYEKFYFFGEILAMRADTYSRIYDRM